MDFCFVMPMDFTGPGKDVFNFGTCQDTVHQKKARVSCCIQWRSRGVHRSFEGAEGKASSIADNVDPNPRTLSARSSNSLLSLYLPQNSLARLPPSANAYAENDTGFLMRRKWPMSWWSQFVRGRSEKLVADEASYSRWRIRNWKLEDQRKVRLLVYIIGAVSAKRGSHLDSDDSSTLLPTNY